MGKRRLRPPRPDRPVDSLLGRPVEGEVDLHGLDARGATMRLEGFVSRWAQTRPGVIVRVITGRGNRSDGPSILRPLARDLFEGSLRRFVTRFVVEPGGGSYLVEVSAPPP